MSSVWSLLKKVIWRKCVNCGPFMRLDTPIGSGQTIVVAWSDEECDQNLLFRGCPSELSSFLLESLSSKTICCPSSGVVFPVCP